MSIGGAELEFERGRIRERQRDGIDRAKAKAGKYLPITTAGRVDAATHPIKLSACQ